MANWAISGQMDRDYKQIVYWANRVQTLQTEAC